MRRILVGCVLLGVCVAGGAVAFGQSSGAPDPLAARIADLEAAYKQTVTTIMQLEGELDQLRDTKLQLEGGIAELRRYQALVQAAPSVEVPEEAPAGDEE